DATISKTAAPRLVLVGSTSFVLEVRLEIQFDIHMEHVAVAADRIRHCRIADRAMDQVEPLRVHSQPPLPDEVPIAAGAQLRRVAVAAKNLRGAQVELQRFLYGHG